MNTFPIQLEKTALVVIDVQKGIAERAEFANPYPVEQLIGKNEELTKALKNTPALIVLVRVKNWGAERLAPLTDNLPMTGGFPPKEFSDLSLSIAHEDDAKNVIVVNKHNWGAFYGTDLDVQLRRRGIDTILLSGVATTIGVDTTAREAYQHGYNQIIIEDACTDMDAVLHKEIVEKMFPKIARVRSTTQVLEMIETAKKA